jgi:hypothetical protein
MSGNKPTIWCLFSVENDYDQPENNLRAWWGEKPTLEALGKYLCRPLDKSLDTEIATVVDIWLGRRAKFRPGDTSWRLEEVQEGGV